MLLDNFLFLGNGKKFFLTEVIELLHPNLFGFIEMWMMLSAALSLTQTNLNYLLLKLQKCTYNQNRSYRKIWTPDAVGLLLISSNFRD